MVSRLHYQIIDFQFVIHITQLPKGLESMVLFLKAKPVQETLLCGVCGVIETNQRNLHNTDILCL